jgi:hypothetical protein
MPAKPQAATAYDSDSNRWRANLAWGILFVGGYLCWSFRLPLLWGHHAAWDVPGDIWEVYNSAIYVAHGGYAFLYDPGTGYAALPLPAIIVAPFELLGERLHLVAGVPLHLSRPSMWFVLAPVVAGGCTPVVWAARSLAWELGVRQRLWLVQLNALLVVSVPCALFGHFEDALAVAGIFMAWRAAARSKWMATAIWCAVAIASKEWAVLAVPIMIAQAPSGQRVRLGAIAVGTPLLLLAPCLLRDCGNTITAVFVASSAHAVSGNGHVGLLSGLVPGEFTQVGVLVLAAICWLFRKWSLAMAMCAVGVLFALRVIAEPVAFLYYFSAPLAVLAMIVVTSGRRVSLARFGFTLVPWLWAWQWPVNHVVWWLGMALVSVALAAVVRDSLRDESWQHRTDVPEAESALRTPVLLSG